MAGNGLGNSTMNGDERRSEEATESVTERNALLTQLQDWLEVPMLVLAFIWLALFVLEMTWGMSRLLQILIYVIWALFVLQFLLELLLAPTKWTYLKRNWLAVIALVAPALRMLSVLRMARVARTAGTLRGVRLVRVLSSLNRGMRALRATMSRRGFGYVVLLTLIVDLAGAAGMYAFEARGFDSYASALWWTSMLITTIASDYWPQTAEGRLLCLFLSLYGLAVFGYVTATLATYFIGRDAESDASELAGDRSIRALRSEIAALRQELRAAGT
ncbi:MAG: potassium channel family protein [Gammaproteobacteria bacterium]|nr:potassium channel family protein [Gammaproteobacteria bacterium]